MNRPYDTSPEAWALQREILARIGPEARAQIAAELSEAARLMHLDGIRARHPEFDEVDAVLQLIWERHGVRIPRRP